MKLEKRAFLLLFIENFLFNAAHNSLSLVSPYLEGLGASRAYLGLFNSVNTIGLALSILLLWRPLAGFRRDACLRWGFLLLALSDFLMAEFSFSLGAFLALKAVGAASYVFSNCYLMGMLYDSTPEESRVGTVALFGISGLLSNPFSSSLAELAARVAGKAGVFLLGAGLALAALAVALFIRDPKRGLRAYAPIGVLGIWKRRELLPLELITFCFGSALTVWLAYLPSYTLSRWGAVSLTAFTLPFAIVSVAQRLLFFKKMDTLPKETLLTVALGALLASFTIVMVAPQPPWLCAVGALYGIAHSILFPVLSAMHVGHGERGEESSYNNAFLVENALGAIIVAPLSGAMGDRFGFFGLWGFMASLFALCLALSLFGLRPKGSELPDRFRG
jgi:predicted MFS family arabinose efflux permease